MTCWSHAERSPLSAGHQTLIELPTYLKSRTQMRTFRHAVERRLTRKLYVEVYHVQRALEGRFEWWLDLALQEPV